MNAPAPGPVPFPLPDRVKVAILDRLDIIRAIVDQAPLLSGDVDIVVEKLVQLARDAEFARWREAKAGGHRLPPIVRAAAEGSGATEASFRSSLEARIRSAVDAPPFCGPDPYHPPRTARPRTAAAPPLRIAPAPTDAPGDQP